MNRINRKVEYALISLKHMVQKKPGQLTTVKEICQAYGAPFDATSRVMQLLVQNKVLKSEQGAYGGYLIQKDLAKMNLLELIEIIMGPIEVIKCINGKDTSDCDLRDKCNVISPLSYLNEKMREFYFKINLSDLLSKGSISPKREDFNPEITSAGMINV